MLDLMYKSRESNGRIEGSVNFLCVYNVDRIFRRIDGHKMAGYPLTNRRSNPRKGLGIVINSSSIPYQYEYLAGSGVQSIPEVWTPG